MNLSRILVNGFPKSGCHALQKACELLGVPAIVTHAPYVREFDKDHAETGLEAGNSLEKDKCILIKRHPKNILISWLRFNQKPTTPGMFISAFRKFDHDSLVNEMGEFERWLTDPNTLVVSYEDLTKDKGGMMAVSSFLKIPYLEGAFEHLEGMTKTYNKVHSDYRTMWTPDVENVWVSEGGRELMARWGY